MSRRSRRSKQKQKKSSPRKGGLKWVACLGVFLLLGGIVGLALGYRAVRKYLQSDEFRVMLGKEVGGLIGGEATFSSFQWTSWEVEVDNFDFTGEGGVRQIQGSNIEASVDIGAVWEGIYRVEDIRLSHLNVVADFREREDVVDQKPEVLEEDNGVKEGPGFWAQFLPDEIEVTRVDVASVDGKAQTDDGLWSWSNIGAKLEPGSGAGVYDVDLRGGEVRSPVELMDRLTLKNAKGRYAGNRFHLLSADLDALDRSRVTMEGFYSLDEGYWNFSGDVTGTKVEEVIAEDWKQRLMGPLEIDYKISGKPEQDARIEGNLQIDDGVLTALPVLDRIAAYANTVRFRRLALSEASLDFTKQGSRLDLTNIRLASEGLVRLEGTLRLNEDLITYGKFRLGIIPGTLAHLPGAETKVFQQGELGLLWTPLVISGTIDSPQEDLSERLIAAAGERMFEMVPETGQWALKHGGAVVGESTKVILANHGVILGAGQGVLDSATDLLKKGAENVAPVPVDQVIDAGKGIMGVGVGTLFDLFGRPIEKEE
ncbi:hypothetical protein N9A94_02025 [Akkermansiaceae bacterium]|nr:hypothetical protein [Akkermansiaceae bacterium]MDA7888443.1 hypothetical protein [Akkermansiaceae bacterium]MDB4537498.1 hypothetical protein [Akkermansiaceae bacterium]